MLDMTGLEELWLCEGTELLLFQNKGPDACAIHAPEDGSGLTLQFIGEYRPHTELPNLRGLHGIELKDFDLTGLAAVHPHLKELRLWGAPGNLGSFSAVGGFRELTNYPPSTCLASARMTSPPRSRCRSFAGSG